MAGVHQPMVGNTKKVRSQILSNLDFIPRFAGTLLSLWHAPLSMGSSSGITKLELRSKMIKSSKRDLINDYCCLQFHLFLRNLVNQFAEVVWTMRDQRGLRASWSKPESWRNLGLQWTSPLGGQREMEETLNQIRGPLPPTLSMVSPGGLTFMMWFGCHVMFLSFNTSTPWSMCLESLCWW